MNLAVARSFLFVPANRPERFVKALGSGADVVIIDLEDAVAPESKQLARDQLTEAFKQMTLSERARVVVRLNAVSTDWFADDLVQLRTLTPLGLSAVMVPKAETTSVLAQVAQSLGTDCALLPQVETLAGLDAVNDLARAPQVARLVFGNIDFQADLGLSCDAQEAELQAVRLALVMASRRAGLAAPVDGVTLATQDEAQLQLDVARSRRGGFTAKLCIHPAQVTGVNAAFTPSASELAWAQRVIDGFAASAGGVFRLDGRMIDAPVVLLARRTLALEQHLPTDAGKEHSWAESHLVQEGSLPTGLGMVTQLRVRRVASPTI
jgi:citrate lyase subunit beta/citryl-CoA lyase